MPDNLEIIRLNKDEEFEYFVNYKKTFHKWSLEEHNIFTKATLDYDILKHDQLNEVLKVINQHNTNINSKHMRTIEELNIHIKVYQNYLNKQSTLRTPLGSNLSTLNTSGGSLASGLSAASTTASTNTGSGLNIGISSSGITNNSLSLLNNIHSVSSNGLLNNELFLSNMITNNYFSIINSLDNSTTPTTNPTSIKDVSSNNPLFQNQQIKLASKPIPTSPQLSPSLSSTTVAPPIHSEGEINNSSYSQEFNKKDLKILNEPWTAEDQKKFEIALEKYPITRFSSVSRWQMVGKEVGITPKAAALRYNRMLTSLVPKKPLSSSSSTSTSTVSLTPIPLAPATISEKEPSSSSGSSIGKRTRRTSASKESPSKKEKITHEITTAAATTTTTTTTTTNTLDQNQYSNQVDDILSKNDLLLEQMKSNIINNEIPSITNLTNIIDNINNSIKFTEKWKSSSSMPPLPLKVNDMILKMLAPTKSTSTSTSTPTSTNPVSTTTSTNPFNILTQKKITPTTNLGKRGLTKNAEEWNLVYDEE